MSSVTNATNVTNATYINRITDTLVRDGLSGLGGLMIVGPKWCGKTTTAEQFAQSAVYLDDSEDGQNLVEVASLSPLILLQGETPRLVDEWQLAPGLFDSARREIDKRRRSGQFIFTGSTTPPQQRTAHSGTGRFSYIQMFPMTLYETGESNGTVSLSQLFEGSTKLLHSSALTIERLAFILVRGGWPGVLGLSEKTALGIPGEYVESLVNSDFLRLQTNNTRRDPAKLSALIRSYARNTATTVSLDVILADVNSSGIHMARATAENYLRDLRLLYAIYDQPAWNGSLRSRTPVRQAPKRHLVDPSLAAAAIGASADMLLMDYKTFGFLFESLCTRDIMVYGSPLKARVGYYRDKYGLEVDITVQLDDGRWGAFEVKLGSRQEEAAAKSLLKLAQKVDPDTTGKPSFLAILTGGKYPYRRDDGVYVIPIGCLGP